LIRSYPIKITEKSTERESDTTVAGGTTINVSARGVYFVNYNYGEIFPGMTFDIVLTVPSTFSSQPHIYPINLHGIAKVVRVDNYYTDLLFSQRIALHFLSPLELDKPCSSYPPERPWRCRVG
jgi:hypothetical protein